MVRILKLWIQHLFSPEFKNIIKGNLNRLLGKNRKLYNRRYSVCRNCPEVENIKGIGEICGTCGCPLKSKLRAEDSHCDLNKWK